MKISKPGIYRDFPTAAYFADPCPEPSFTQSLAKILIEQSPLHAYQAHPRLNVPAADEDADEAEKYSKAKAIGNAAHSLMLGRGKVLAVGDFNNWMTARKPSEFKATATEPAGADPAQAFRDRRRDGRRRARAAMPHSRLRAMLSRTATPKWCSPIARTASGCAA
jgi:endonuclease/exonuclease/phosphatase family metal-dependent hydrolase